ncbi:MAG: ABC transporter ATP-binding protein [Candidatus Poribacteria bacterium]|nr:ABC transporter ATP-binding protein [Candidatus Poribacteria bacterium]
MFSFMLVLVTNGLLLVSPKILELVFDDFEKSITPRKVFLYALLIFTVALGGGAILFAQRRIINGVARRIEYHLRNDFFTHLQKLSAAYYNRVDTGDLMARATSDINAVRMVLSNAIMFTADGIVFFAMAFVIMLRIDATLTLLAVLPYPILALLIRELGKRIYRSYERIQESFSTMNTKLQENLSGVRVVKAYTLEKSEIDKFRDLNRTFVDRNRAQIRLFSVFFPLFRCLPGIGHVALLYLGGIRVIEGQITFGEFVALLAYLILLVRPMIRLGFVVNAFERGAASMERISKILDEQPEIYDGVNARHGIEAIQGGIEFRNLSFSYPDGTPVLKNINLKVDRGQTVAIVGPTGCGKTTLVNLIPRLYEADRGTIFIDGVDVQDIPLHVLRSNIGVVEQEPFLFSGTLRNNIAYGAENAGGAEVNGVVRIADLQEQMEEFPDGLDTYLGERGITISGGQRQRTALARAIAIHPKILILDSAFANVDTHTEDIILNRLKEVMENRTTIVISHRISTVKSADLIIVMKNGEIVERGTHDTLLKRNGIYTGIYDKQLLQEELDSL